METEEKKLTSSEIDAMLKEVEEIHQPIRTSNNNRKKKPIIRIDMIIAAVVVIAIIVGAVLAVKHFSGRAKPAMTKKVQENPLMDEKYPEISDVVRNYLNAYLVEEPQKRHSILAQYVDNMGDINEGDISQNKYVTGYSNIECYSKEGPYENTYVVYAYYEMELKNILTSVPTITTLYVMRDSNTGNVYIHNGVSSDVEKYIKEVSADSDVQELFASVNKDFKDALNSDDSLKAFFDKLEATTASKTESKESDAATQSGE